MKTTLILCAVLMFGIPACAGIAIIAITTAMSAITKVRARKSSGSAIARSSARELLTATSPANGLLLAVDWAAEGLLPNPIKPHA
jgi:hypothetical protein